MTRPSASTSQTGRATVGLLVATVVAGLGLLALIVSLLLPHADDAASPRRVAQNDPSAVDAQPSFVPTLSASTDRSGTDLAPATPNGVEPLAPAETGGPAQESKEAAALWLTGRLLSLEGAPIAHGDVWYVPVLGTVADRFARGRAVGERLADFPHAKTDATGRFTVSLPAEVVDAAPGPEGDWPALVGLAEGYAMGALDIPGPARSARDVGDLTLEPGVTAHGVVVTEAGNAIAGALVSTKLGFIDAKDVKGAAAAERPANWWTAERLLSRNAGDDGRFEIPGVPLGRSVSFVAESDGFAPGTLQVAAVDREDSLQSLRIVLHRGSRLVASVRDERGADLEHARVFATPRQPFELPESIRLRLPEVRRWGARGVRDASGVFVVEGLTESSYDVFAEAQGYEPARVQVGMTQAAPVVALVLRPEAIARLRVIDQSTSEPVETAIPQAWAYVVGGIGSTALPLPVDRLDDGEFLVHGLGPLKTHVRVKAPGYAARLETIAGAEPGTTAELVVHLGVEGVISGSMTTADGRPLAGVAIRASMKAMLAGGLAEESRLETVTDSSGEYELRGVGPAEWQLHATLPTYVPVSETITVERDGDRVEWSRVLLPGATITGVLKLSNGRPQVSHDFMAFLVAPNKATAAQGMRTSQATSTGPGGEFSFAGLAPGTWQIGGKRGVTVEVKAGEKKTVDVVWPAPPTIVGRVIGDGGAPIAALVIALPSAGGNIGGVARTQRSGDYELTLGGGGDFVLQALCIDPVGCTDMGRVTCQVGQVARCDLQVGRCTVSGACVSGQERKPVAGARVVLEREGYPNSCLLSSDSDGVQMTFWPVTDEQGLFEMRAGPGKYTVRASANGYASASAELEIAPGATTATVDFVLSAE